MAKISDISTNTRKEYLQVTLRILNDVCDVLEKNPTIIDESLMADLRWLRQEEEHVYCWYLADEINQRNKN